MPKTRKRKVPITGVSSTSNATSSKPKSSRAVIRGFHVLLKQQAQLQKVIVDDISKKTELADIEREIEELGGLESYQRMSAIGQGTDRGGGSEKILIRWLKDKELHKPEKKLRLLEVGALKPDNYADCSSWIKATPIDLNSQHPSIMEQDFLLLDHKQNRENWDIISLSLVLNFVPEPLNRGEFSSLSFLAVIVISCSYDTGRMLRLSYDFLVGGGHLFVALPLSCLSNSRYLNFDFFSDLMEILGFSERQRHWRKGGKMVYYLFQKRVDARMESITVPDRFSKKTILRQGNRNNFSIIL
ncbi:nucleolus protein [Lentinula aciculospora]|uniref:25S rRNA adenine-N(1) methyltransferase n=1 Tax=Lentinula aciculospora TaxID=153920 RepID=A0A9W9DVP1_9AGAR|nr:nucleolus protein [Lentinula aciculospora]